MTPEQREQIKPNLERIKEVLEQSYRYFDRNGHDTFSENCKSALVALQALQEKQTRTQLPKGVTAKPIGWMKSEDLELIPIMESVIIKPEQFREYDQALYTHPNPSVPVVPPSLNPYTNTGECRPDFSFRIGWNACRDAMLKTVPDPLSSTR